MDVRHTFASTSGAAKTGMAKSVMEFGGEERFAVSPARLFGVMTDLEALPAAIPDLQSHERIDEQTLRCVIRPGFSFMRGKMNVDFRLAEVVSPESALVLVAARGIGTSVRMESRMWVRGDGAEGSLLKWETHLVELKGLVSAVSPTLLKAAADQVIRHTWAKVRERLETA